LRRYLKIVARRSSSQSPAESTVPVEECVTARGSPCQMGYHLVRRSWTSWTFLDVFDVLDVLDVFDVFDVFLARR
jgi:hypothetical protein